MRTYRKGTSETIRRGIDWSDRLIEGDQIAESSWTVAQGITAEDSAFDGTYADIDLSGGTVNTTYRLTNEVDTSEGLTYERSFDVIVVDR